MRPHLLNLIFVFKATDVPGFILWRFFYYFMKYGKLWVHLTKELPKVKYQVAHSGKNKQSFQLALAVFYETTTAAII